MKDRWFCTYTGTQFYPFDPKPEQVLLEDIAHHLALQCRYNGACRNFYSVAQHSVLVANLVSDANSPWALLHDAAEAYVGDMVRPLKLGIPQYLEIEARIEAVIAKRFGLPPTMPEEVKFADNIMLYAERRDLMPTNHAWSLQKEMEPHLHKIAPIIPMTPERAYADFMVWAREYGLDEEAAAGPPGLDRQAHPN